MNSVDEYMGHGVVVGPAEKAITVGVRVCEVRLQLLSVEIGLRLRFRWSIGVNRTLTEPDEEQEQRQRLHEEHSGRALKINVF